MDAAAPADAAGTVVARIQKIRLMSLVVLVCGVLVSLYAYYVEEAKVANPAYVAYCDLGRWFSCSAVLSSRYSRGLGLVEGVLGKEHWANQPNSVLGVIVYSAMILLNESTSPTVAKIFLAMTALSNVTSVYLGYVMLAVLQDVCLLCLTVYLINVLTLVLVYRKVKLLTCSNLFISTSKYRKINKAE